VTLDLDIHLEAIAAGDADAFGRWVAGAERPLRLSLRSYASVIDTEAALQEALLRTWNHADRVKPDGRPNALLRWARRCLRNHAIDSVRKRSPDLLDPTLLEAAATPVAPIEPDPLLLRALTACRKALPGAPGRALTARLEGRGCRHDRELAATVEMSLNTFLKNVGRARALLTECLHKQGIRLEAS